VTGRTRLFARHISKASPKAYHLPLHTSTRPGTSGTASARPTCGWLSSARALAGAYADDIPGTPELGPCCDHCCSLLFTAAYCCSLLETDCFMRAAKCKERQGRAREGIGEKNINIAYNTTSMF
jgi:hypothetical protein